ncbi:GTP-binding protein SAR1 [Enteropsectra breve]|nr:GTP-binding protein SAR1 [Enteropsectra breve]
MASISEYSVLIRRKISEIYDITIGRFVSRLFRRPSSVLFLGIDNAGKTTLVNKLKTNKNAIFMPTKHAKEEVVEIGNLLARIIDIGGHKQVRMAWKDYFNNVEGVVFLVDTHDRERLHEVRESWEAVKDLARDAPIVVLMNKIDAYNDTSDSLENNYENRARLEEEIGMGSDRSRNNVALFYVSIIKENTYDKNSELVKSFEWLSGKIEENYKAKASK